MTQYPPTLAMAPSQAQKKHISYLPELDSLRTLAVVMTLLAHFSPIEIPYMWYGVPVFFTISGFLITSILLNTLKEGQEVSRLKIIKNFMVRRVLRLFPIYYLFIIFFWLAKRYLSLYLWKDEFTPYFFTYTPNFLIHKVGSENALCFAHLWSLGVEEQFYLFWPWVLLFPSQRFRLPIFVLLICFSLSYIFINHSDPNIGAFPFANFHTLGVGAVLAYFYVQQGKVIDWLKTRRHTLFYITFLHLILVLIFFKESSAGWHLYRDISLCCCTFSIVLVSIFGWKGIFGYFTRNKQVQYIGTISYGIYLYHMPVPFVYRALQAKYFPSVHMSSGVFLIFCFTVTIGLAALSYKYIELPFLRLKKYFA
jgi:peptidoglycan/LPS O-acetylase OafA/YrhL